MPESFVQKIDRLKLCLGCGICEAIAGKDEINMQLGEDGFFHPITNHVSKENDDLVRLICPATNIIIEPPLTKSSKIWGNILSLSEGYATDPEVRFRGSSGGVASALAISLLEQGTIDAMLHIGHNGKDYHQNMLKISRTSESVLNNSGSRYAPALVFNELIKIINESDEVFGFIGKPCDVAALKNFLTVYPKYKERFKVTIAIFCAGMPSFNGTQELINTFQASSPVTSLHYRGNGWPGFFSFTDSKGDAYKKAYNDSWGGVLNRHLSFRCKICADGIGLSADISVGDAWELNKEGYPDFSEKPGKSLIISRTSVGQEIINKALEQKAIRTTSFEYEKLRIIQSYQYWRRKKAGTRALAFQLAKGFKLKFRGMRLYSNLIGISPLVLLKEFYGTYLRARKIK